MAEVVCSLVELCVFRFPHDRAEYLMLKRSQVDIQYPGIWQIITGTIRKGERAVDAALREMDEETALRPTRFWAVPFSSTFYSPDVDRMNISAFFAAEVKPTDDPVLSSEHERCEWMPYDDARRNLVWPGQRSGLEIVDHYIVRGEEAGIVTIIPLPC